MWFKNNEISTQSNICALIYNTVKHAHNEMPGTDDFALL